MASLAQLKVQVAALNLEVTKSGYREAKSDYVRILRAHYLNQGYPHGLPYEELCPMLCYDFWKLSVKEQDAVWRDNNDWIAQQKLNGCRLILHFIKDVGVFAHSRTVSEATYRRSDLTSRLLFHDFVPKFTATVDCEAVCDKPITDSKGATLESSLQATVMLLHAGTETSIRLQVEQEVPLIVHVFDITRWGDIDLRPKRLCERLGYLADVQKALRAAEMTRYFAFPLIHFAGKRAFYEQVLDLGGEGIVLKHLNSTYIDSSARSRTGWLKVKRVQEFDAYVSGFEPGRPSSDLYRKVACLHFSVVTDQGPKLVAKVSNLPWLFRKEISVFDSTNGEVRLNPSQYGRVARVSGMEFSRRAFRLVHPKIARWRPELKQRECVYSIQDLQSIRAGATNRRPLRIVGKESSNVS